MEARFRVFTVEETKMAFDNEGNRYKAHTQGLIIRPETTMSHKGVDNRPGVWYYTYVDACVLCGREDICRERRVPPKPENYLDRCSYKEYACEHHFL